MEPDWDEVTRIGLDPPRTNGRPPTATATIFDPAQELVWVGNESGRITSFYGPELQRYTSYQGHLNEGSVKRIALCDKGVISISSRSIHLSSRRGLAQWHCTDESFQDLRCMTFTSKGSADILVAGCQDVMYKIGVEKGDIIEKIPAEDHYTLMKRGGQYICAATSTGSVQLLDQRTFAVLKTWKAHLDYINDMDTNSSFLVTCGWSSRQQYGHVLDPLAKVFDLKNLMPLSPVPFHVGAAFVRMHPKMLTTGLITSQNGQMQVVDIMNATMISMRHVNLMDGYLTCLELAPSGDALVLTDSQACVHLWGARARLRFAEVQNQTELPDPPSLHASLDWAGNKPFHTIGMPYYRETLLSVWPGHLTFDVGAPPASIDPIVLSNLTRTEYGAWAPNPQKVRRNQVEDTRALEKAIHELEGPRFLSEQAKDGHADGEAGRRMSEVLDALLAHNIGDTSKSDVPLMYHNVEIKYSKYGVDDFDFEFYNKTRYSGLETHIANSYINPLLQLMRFTPVIRNLALHHTANACAFESCLLCEMGYLCDMLEKASGLNCQATNFLKVFSNLPLASNLGLFEDSAPTRHITVLIQQTNKFLLDKFAQDFRQISPQYPRMDQAVTTKAVTSIRCAHCAMETVRPGNVTFHELLYPPRPNSKNQRSPSPSFSQILKVTVERQQSTRGWCDRCKRYQQLSSRKTIQALPPVLILNAAIFTTEAKQFWSRPRLLPQEIGIIIDQGQFFCYEGQDLEMHLQRGVFKIQVYELVGVVAEINREDPLKQHLVSLINVAPSSVEKEVEDSWHLFNDFLVRKIPGEEALTFDPLWKMPSILTYQIKSARHHIDDSWKQDMDMSPLYQRWQMQLPDESDAEFHTLSYPSERPGPGTIVGIDAEFVALQHEELEVKADGSRSVLRPARSALARVSVLRGGHGNSLATDVPLSPISPSLALAPSYIPFIDDYIINTTEPVVDYLTEWSGISPGDLDPKTSPYAKKGRLISLKLAYKKIWLLLNAGVIFVGHGLPKDFRIINIHVPKAQVIDTVDLFYIKARQRKLSLRFLAWYLLREDVQSGTHDSIEDARTALKLWRKYEEYHDAGIVEPILNEVYNRGREVGFRVPVSAAGNALMSTTSRPSSSMGPDISRQ